MAGEATERILLVDDEPLYLRTTAELLRRAGFECQTAVDASDALKQLERQRPDLMIVDLNMPGNMQLELLDIGRREFPDIPMIVVTGAPTLQSAISSIRLRIADYLLKPVKFTDLEASVRRALAGSRLAASDSGAPGVDSRLMIGQSRGMQEVNDLILRAAAVDASVLITGESGTGKELAALTLHRASRRRHAPFVTVDCTTIPDSLFESVMFGHTRGAFTGANTDQPGLLKQADGGTVLLDEIGELPLVSQAKLLRLIQDSTFTPVGSPTSLSIDVRFVTATNRDLAEEVHLGRFRRDLFYRLAVIPIHLPPLRQHDDDVVFLARYFLQSISTERGISVEFSDEAIRSLKAYSWPGNIRELRNVIERAVALCRGSIISLADLQRTVSQSAVHSSALAPAAASTRDEVLARADQEYLTELLKQSSGNVSVAADLAGLTRQGTYKLLQKYGIDPDAFRRS